MKKLIQIMLMMLALSFLNSCGTEEEETTQSDGTSIVASSSFQETSINLNKTSLDLAESAQAFGLKYNALSEFDPTQSSGKAIVAPLEEMIAEGESFLSDLEKYQQLLAEYHADTTNTKAAIQRQSVDPLLVYDIANFIKDGKTEADAINALIASGVDDNEAYAALNKYKKTKMGAAFTTGVSSLIGGGAGALAGSAVVAGAAVLSAPVVLTATAVGIGVGVIVGGFVSWCAGPSKAVTRADSSEEVCSMAAIKTQTVELPNGEIGFALNLPQGGPGDLCIHVEGKAPICLKTEIKESGNTINISCLDGSFDPSQAAECNEETTVEDGVAITGESCYTDIVSLSASPTAGSGGADVVIHASLPTPGCSISYSLVGTDGYTQSGTLTTDASGNVSFHVPPGDDGVHDSVTMTATASGASTTAGYTF